MRLHAELQPVPHAKLTQLRELIVETAHCQLLEEPALLLPLLEELALLLLALVQLLALLALLEEPLPLLALVQPLALLLLLLAKGSIGLLKVKGIYRV